MVAIRFLGRKILLTEVCFVGSIANWCRHFMGNSYAVDRNVEKLGHRLWHRIRSSYSMEVRDLLAHRDPGDWALYLFVLVRCT